MRALTIAATAPTTAVKIVEGIPKISEGAFSGAAANRISIGAGLLAAKMK